MNNNIPDFLLEEYKKRRGYLKDISSATLPDNPSAHGFSAEDIRRKQYEPIIQLFDWYYETKGDVVSIQEQILRIFKIDLSSYLIASSIPNEFKLVGNVNEEVIETIKEYLNAKLFKDIAILLNNQIKIVHTIVEENENNYFLRGVGIKESSVQGANLEIIINKVSKEISGTVSFSANFKDLSSEISKMKDDLLKFCDKKYVPKQDMQTLNPNGLDYAYVDKNGDIKQGKALTVGGVIKVNTYDLEDYSIGGN